MSKERLERNNLNRFAQKNIFRNTWFLNGCLLGVIGLVFLLNFYSETLFYRPVSIHQWRQADCLSITKNYYEEGMHFLSPKVHSLRAKNGKAVSEFPLLNYTVAVLWKVFGEQEYLYRLLEYGIFLASIFVLFNTLFRFFYQRLVSFFMVSLLLTSPLLAYYSFNFLSDVPALSFCVMSFCFLFSFYKTQRQHYFYLALVFSTLAVLLKASALTGLSCLTCLCLVDFLNLNRFFKIEKLFRVKTIPIIALALCFFLVDSWYSYALHYNQFNNGFFLLTTLPIWEMKDDMIFQNLRQLMSSLLPEFLNRPVLSLFFLMIVFVIVHFKKLDVFLRGAFLFSGLFFILYILLFFQVFNVHDYYLTTLFIFPVILFFCLADLFLKLDLKAGVYARVAMILLFVFNAFYAAAFYRLRMIKDDKLCVWYPFVSQDEKNYFGYSMWSYENRMKPLETIRPDLRALGIRRSDVVIEIGDESPNAALYFMDQKGYSFSTERFASDTLDLRKVWREAKYVVLSDSTYKNSEPFRKIAPQLEPVFKKRHVEVFKIKR